MFYYLVISIFLAACCTVTQAITAHSSIQLTRPETQTGYAPVSSATFSLRAESGISGKLHKAVFISPEELVTANSTEQWPKQAVLMLAAPSSESNSSTWEAIHANAITVASELKLALLSPPSAWSTLQSLADRIPQEYEARLKLRETQAPEHFHHFPLLRLMPQRAEPAVHWIAPLTCWTALPGLSSCPASAGAPSSALAYAVDITQANAGAAPISAAWVGGSSLQGQGLRSWAAATQPAADSLTVLLGSLQGSAQAVSIAMNRAAIAAVCGSAQSRARAATQAIVLAFQLSGIQLHARNGTDCSALQCICDAGPVELEPEAEDQHPELGGISTLLTPAAMLCAGAVCPARASLIPASVEAQALHDHANRLHAPLAAAGLLPLTAPAWRADLGAGPHQAMSAMAAAAKQALLDSGFIWTGGADSGSCITESAHWHGEGVAGWAQAIVRAACAASPSACDMSTVELTLPMKPELDALLHLERHELWMQHDTSPQVREALDIISAMAGCSSAPSLGSPVDCTQGQLSFALVAIAPPVAPLLAGGQTFEVQLTVLPALHNEAALLCAAMALAVLLCMTTSPAAAA